uniref:Uncharacterized protein n=1 Tax=Candidatus Kentrum sp. FM TaxID=2126340 RepID=A0A450VYN4_9GAMM|nr:MAG: hypothetical protein BECKFM1743B_GA0114221_101209 [Candidatus Kentron sp. FM]
MKFEEVNHKGTKTRRRPFFFVSLWFNPLIRFPRGVIARAAVGAYTGSMNKIRFQWDGQKDRENWR